jgi:hypothetical protein
MHAHGTRAKQTRSKQMEHDKYTQLHDICVKTVIAIALIAAPALAWAPAAPTNFKILEESNKYVKVSFRDRSTNENTFSVWRRLWPNGEFSKVGERYGNPSGTSRVYEILISDSGQPACFRASADNADGPRLLPNCLHCGYHSRLAQVQRHVLRCQAARRPCQRSLPL